MDLSKQRIDTTSECEGVWVDYDGETRFRIARWLNPRHKDYVQRRLEPYKRQLRTGALSPDVEESIEVDALAHAILLDWEGLTDNGKPLPYSVATARTLLSDPALSWLRDFVRDTSNELALFRAQDLEEGAENVKKLSRGRSAVSGGTSDSSA